MRTTALITKDRATNPYRRSDVIARRYRRGCDDVRLFAGTLANATLQERIAAHDPPLPRLIKPRLDMCFTGECLRRR